jgi:hypothetical protein
MAEKLDRTFVDFFVFKSAINVARIRIRLPTPTSESGKKYITD